MDRAIGGTIWEPRKEGQTIKLRLASGTMTRGDNGPIIGRLQPECKENLSISQTTRQQPSKPTAASTMLLVSDDMPLLTAMPTSAEHHHGQPSRGETCQDQRGGLWRWNRENA
jgi:hypothetical protein